jgi:hypothetical protein
VIALTLVGRASFEVEERAAAAEFERRFVEVMPSGVLGRCIVDAMDAFRIHSNRPTARKVGFLPLHDRRTVFADLAAWLRQVGRTDLVRGRLPRLYFRDGALLTTYEDWAAESAGGEIGGRPMDEFDPETCLRIDDLMLVDFREPVTRTHGATVGSILSFARFAHHFPYVVSGFLTAAKHDWPG